MQAVVVSFVAICRVLLLFLLLFVPRSRTIGPNTILLHVTQPCDSLTAVT